MPPHPHLPSHFCFLTILPFKWPSCCFLKMLYSFLHRAFAHAVIADWNDIPICSSYFSSPSQPKWSKLLILQISVQVLLSGRPPTSLIWLPPPTVILIAFLHLGDGVTSEHHSLAQNSQLTGGLLYPQYLAGSVAHSRYLQKSNDWLNEWMNEPTSFCLQEAYSLIEKIDQEVDGYTVR